MKNEIVMRSGELVTPGKVKCTKCGEEGKTMYFIDGEILCYGCHIKKKGRAS